MPVRLAAGCSGEELFMCEKKRKVEAGNERICPVFSRGKCGRAAFDGKIVVDVFRLKKMEKLWGKRRVAFDGKMVGGDVYNIVGK